MTFDWLRFLEEYRIPYVTRGHNVTRGNVAIRCPYCGSADPSEHMGLKLDLHRPYWHCWRNPAHSGRSPRRLVQKLLGCTFARAREIVAAQQLMAAPDSFEQAVVALQSAEAAVEPDSPQSAALEPWRPEFRPLPGAGAYAAQFMRYLAEDRGFGADAEAVAARFRLHYCLAGEYAWRLIVPFYDAEQRLVGWTARAVRAGAAVRYYTARGCGASTLYGEDWAAVPPPHGRLLLVVEGPFDAIKLQYYGEGCGCVAVATLGTAVSVERVVRLVRLGEKYPGGVVVVFDPDAQVQAWRVVEALSVFLPVVSGVADLAAVGQGRDPADLSAEQVRALCSRLLAKHLTEEAE